MKITIPNIYIQCCNENIDTLKQLRDNLLDSSKCELILYDIKEKMLNSLNEEIKKQEIYYIRELTEYHKRFLVKIPEDRKYFPSCWNDAIFYAVKDNKMGYKQLYKNEDIPKDATHIYECGK
jgi:hypothetical protein